MSLFEKIKEKQESIAIVGLGYVGINIAVEFSKYTKVIGYDIDSSKIQSYIDGIDVTSEIGNDGIKNCTVFWTCDELKLQEAKFIVIAVPTPVDLDNQPDLSCVISASHIVGRNMSIGSIIVYESTVYPGVTEEICKSILEKESGLICGKDFKIGYSPERINPGDKYHRFADVKKVVSGIDSEALETIAEIYGIAVKAGVYKAPSIKVAEACKLIENTQRDINIAFVNEASMIFDAMGLDTLDVLRAAQTKWNFSKYTPGIVGGHCIGIDPYYLSYCANEHGCASRIISSSREVNSEMGKYIAQQIIKQIIKAGVIFDKAKIGFLGITFKENCNDIRNTKAVEIISELKEYGLSIIVHDTLADGSEVKRQYGIDLSELSDFYDLDCLIIAVPHNDFNSLTTAELKAMFKKSNNKKVLIDIKGSRNKSEWKGDLYWRL